MDNFQITIEGFEKLKIELDDLKNNQRPAIIQAIATARELGDLKENAEYHSAKDRQGFIEAQINDLSIKFSQAEVVDVSKETSHKVKFGAKIKLEDINSGKIFNYQIVSEYEADIEKGLISNTSPVARALIEKEVGDEVEIQIPSGTVFYEIIEIKYV